MPCSSCKELRTWGPGKHDSSSTIASTNVDGGRQGISGLPRRVGKLQIFVGIGNPGNRYRNTPHNVGFDIADAVAQRLGATWQTLDDLLFAHSVVNGNTLLLVKPQNYVNNIGKTLKGLSGVMDFTAQECTLLQDDVHLPLGKIRSRMRGSDGGHKGIRSVLAEFQTDEFKRIKVGVAPTEAGTPKADYLVTPFSAEDAPRMIAAVEAVADRIMSTLEQSDGSGTLAPSRASIPAATE